MTNETIPIGAIFTVTQGEYSDFCIDGVFKALKELNSTDLVAEFNTTERVGTYEFESAFLAWLIRKGYIDCIECFELYLTHGSYNRPSFGASVSKYEGKS